MRSAANSSDRSRNRFLLSYNLLYGIPCFPVHNGLMIIFKIIALIRRSFIRLLRQEILWRLLLKQLIAHICLILKDIHDIIMCKRLAFFRPDSIISQQASDLLNALAFNIHLKDHANRIRILIRYKFAVNTVISKDTVIPDVILSALEAFPISPPDVFRNRAALVLRDCREK